MNIELEVIDNVIQPKYVELKNGKYVAKVTNIDLRTKAQNRSQWLWFAQIAQLFKKLNLDVTMVLRMDTKWTDKKVKAMIFDPTIEDLYQKDSSTKLNKDEYELIILSITKAFGMKGITLPRFPSIKTRGNK